ncbi:MAG: hypothetical protein JO061_00280, partial [Acidobacteriaceae bacterium]|nr:hypothetical protein [Acidobacteriaceae bacterium]
MRKRSPVEQLDLAVDALLAPAERSLAAPLSPMIAELVSLVPPLRNLPRPEFKARLKTDLQRRISMNHAASPGKTVEPADFRRENFPNIAPAFFVNNAPKFIDFLVAAFNGAERVRVPRPDGSIMYAEVAIGNSVVELAEANQEYPQGAMTTHLYV